MNFVDLTIEEAKKELKELLAELPLYTSEGWTALREQLQRELDEATRHVMQSRFDLPGKEVAYWKGRAAQVRWVLGREEDLRTKIEDLTEQIEAFDAAPSQE